ncbi:Uncharacterized protein MSYG_1608 [Malassezia sympodialis ATCC 42132]|uniref:Uncharacterized protein n=1 Tax=Malassezia sympodialis (strain ATCC 42132) TaxID=1230383 RepID=A0A1M8A4M5_MALS4|nr:Uncharacterized protein MSYG_1608 [Malassezia sympodialis ATCC 42132]
MHDICALHCKGLEKVDDDVGTTLAFVKASNLVSCPPSNNNCNKVWSNPELQVDFHSFGITNNGLFVTGISFSQMVGSDFDNSSTDAFTGSSLGVTPMPGTTGYASLQVPMKIHNVTFTGCGGAPVGGKVYTPTQNFVDIKYMATKNTTNEDQGNPPLIDASKRNASVPNNAVFCSGAERLFVDSYPRLGVRVSDVILCPMGNNDCPVPTKNLRETFYSYAVTATGLPVSGFDLGKAMSMDTQRDINVQGGSGTFTLKPGQTGYEMVYINMIGMNVVFTGCDSGEKIGGMVYTIQPDPETHVLELTESKDPDQNAPGPEAPSMANHLRIPTFTIIGFTLCISLAMVFM